MIDFSPEVHDLEKKFSLKTKQRQLFDYISPAAACQGAEVGGERHTGTAQKGEVYQYLKALSSTWIL